MPDWRLKSEPVGGNIAIYSKIANYSSSSSVAIGTGTKVFTVSAGLPILVGDYLWCEPIGIQGAIFMVGVVTGYSGTTLTLNVIRAVSSGTYASWRLVDHTPLYAPFLLRSKERMQFHTAAPCPSTTPALTQSVVVNIPALNFNTVAHRNYNAQVVLFAHGKASAPMVTGKVLNLGGSGVHVGINGSLPVFMRSDGFGTWIDIGSDGTNVIAEINAILHTSETPRAAQSITIEASAFDVTVSGGLPGNNPSAPLMKHVSGSYTTLGRERIDTRKRYLRQTPSGGDFALSKDETLSIIGDGGGAYIQSSVGWRLRYSVNGYVKQTTLAWDGSATTGGTRNADFVLVKK